MRHVVSVAAAVVISFAAAGCSKDEPAQATQSVQPQAQPAAPAPAPEAKKDLPPGEEASKIYKERCTVCHGSTGAGDGVGAAALNPKPRAFGDAEWQKSVTDEHIALVIEKGGAAGGKSPLMPPNPDLVGKAEVIAELVKLVRGFGK